MAKKRKCRYTPEELAVHEEAVRLRKLTDAQLVSAFQNASLGAQMPEKNEASDYTGGVEKLLTGLESGAVKGIKGATAYKVRVYASEMGLI